MGVGCGVGSCEGACVELSSLPGRSLSSSPRNHSQVESMGGTLHIEDAIQ